MPFCTTVIYYTTLYRIRQSNIGDPDSTYCRHSLQSVSVLAPCRLAWLTFTPRVKIQIIFITHTNQKPTKRSVLNLVRMKGLEPSRLAALAPKASVSTNSTTSAYHYYIKQALLKAKPLRH